MKLSVIIPAYNEEKLLGACLESVRAASAACSAPGLSFEVIVCDNNSTDSTAAIAAAGGARAVAEPVNQIARARNTGAAAASGDWLLFIDADSILSAATLSLALEAMRSGRFAGGGAVISFDRVPHPVGALLVNAWNRISRVNRWAAGSFIFCRADAFREIGGFPGWVYAGEEVFFSIRLKRWGRARGLGFTILTGAPHISSGRKLYLYSGRELALLLLKSVFLPFHIIRGRKHLGLFYDGRR